MPPDHKPTYLAKVAKVILDKICKVVVPSSSFFNCRRLVLFVSRRRRLGVSTGGSPFSALGHEDGMTPTPTPTPTPWPGCDPPTLCVPAPVTATAVPPPPPGEGGIPMPLPVVTPGMVTVEVPVPVGRLGDLNRPPPPWRFDPVSGGTAVMVAVAIAAAGALLVRRARRARGTSPTVETVPYGSHMHGAGDRR